MPIPAGQYRPSNLTKQQRQEQLAAIYGVSMPLTETEIARMRQLVLEHDSQAKKATIHDLNNPPKEQYRFQKFPMVVYDHQSSSPARDDDQPNKNGLGYATVHIPARVVSMEVNSEKELKDALAAGWSEMAPEFREEREEPLSPKYQNEAGRVQERIEELKPKRGRPSNAELAARMA
jgi:hypothetical protein